MNKSNAKVADKFNSKYEEFIANTKLVRDELKKSLALAKQLKLHTSAKSLIKYGDDKCYVQDDEKPHLMSIHYLKPIAGISNLSEKIDNLEWLMNIEQYLKDIIDDIECCVKK